MRRSLIVLASAQTSPYNTKKNACCFGTVGSSAEKRAAPPAPKGEEPDAPVKTQPVAPPASPARAGTPTIRLSAMLHRPMPKIHRS